MKLKPRAEIRRHKDKQGTRWWLIDAEPSLISTIKALCPQTRPISSTENVKGEFISLPYLLSDTVKTGVCLDWILYRYERVTRVSDEDREQIRALKLIDDKREEMINGFEETLASPSSPDMSPFFLGELRDYQTVFVKMAECVKKILLADDLGLGKTIEIIAALMLEGALPALIVTPGFLNLQWKQKIEEFVYAPTIEILEGYKPRPLRRNVDFYITSYDRLTYWEPVLTQHGFKSIAFDEVHELRHETTKKRDAAALIAQTADYCLAASATPIFNNAGEIWSVMDVISPGCLGYFSEFQTEHCGGGKLVLKPDELGRKLREKGLMLRRTAAEVGIQNGDMVVDVVTVEASLEELQKIEDVAKLLAQKTLLGNFAEAGEASRQFDLKLRQATGVAKARAVCAFVTQLLEGGAETVLLATHHHDVNSQVAALLKEHKPAFYNGRCSTAQKAAALSAFKNYKQTGCRVLVMHLRSGQGVDGLEAVCNHVVYGELDWSPAAHAQFGGRLAPWRNNATLHDAIRKVVYAYYVIINDGSDPSMIEYLGIKKAQRDGLVDLKASGVFNEAPPHRIAEMAAAYLEKRKQSVFKSGNAKPTEVGLKLAAYISALEYPVTAGEKVMCDTIWPKLQEYGSEEWLETGREVSIGPECRVDFLVEDIAVEAKVGGDRSQIYRQLERYAKCRDVNEIILICPWPLASFGIEGVYVHVVTYNGKQLM